LVERSCPHVDADQRRSPANFFTRPLTLLFLVAMIVTVIGFTSGRIPEVPANHVLLKNYSVVGLHWGNYQMHNPDLVHDTHQALCEMYEQGRIRPVIYREYPLAELPDALDAGTGPAGGGLLRLSSLLHGQAKDRRHRRSRGQVPPPLRAVEHSEGLASRLV
jgi:hypothetical protein